MHNSIAIFAITSLAQLASAAVFASETNTLFATSNLWGTSVSEHASAVSSAIAQVGTNDVAIQQWFVQVCRYVDFPVSAEDASWMSEKGRLVGECVRFPAVTQSTNCWFEAADLLGRFASLESNLHFAPTNVSISTEGEWHSHILSQNADFLRFQQIRNACQQAIRETRHAVSDIFPWYILPRLTPNECMSIVSNVAERASLDPEDIGVLVRRRLQTNH